jgi:hypothetical protein
MPITVNTLKDKTMVPTLSQAECASLASKIFELRQHWIKRTMQDFTIPLSFWTIGYATYLDGPEGHVQSKNGMNSFLLKHFSGLYEKVSAALQESLQREVRTYPEYNLPGFHIYQGNPNLPLGLYCGGTIHYDTPHKRANFQFAVSDEEVFSFTLPIQLPKRGGGLNYWPEIPAHLPAGDWFHQSPPETKEWLAKNVKHLKYNTGLLVIHDCNILHQMSNEVKTDPDDWRITLQGHGIFREDHWMIYF